MKTRIFTIFTLTALLFVGSVKTFAQEAEEAASPFSIGADVVSSYVWRGTNFGGPAIQPGISYGVGGFTIGAWGSWGFNNSVREADLYLGYDFDFGLSLGATDYYYQGSDYFEYGDSISSHAFEINAGYGIGDFSLSANYIINNSSNGAGSIGGDMYFEAGYAFKYFDVFVGAGNGWHTTIDQDNGDDAFGICRIGIGTSKEIKITDNFTLPMFGSVEVNPNGKEFNIVAGISF